MSQPNDSSPASPCCGVCRICPRSGWCEGCARTLDEIASWAQSTVAQKQALLAQLPARLEALAMAAPAQTASSAPTQAKP